jgi:isopentenyl-diphosphate Delta-isomerase
MNNLNKEFVNVVNIKDKIIDVDEKDNCHKLGLWHRCSVIYVYSNEGLIIQKRAKNKQIEAGKLDHSAAGHVRMNESYSEGAIRELYEELGIRLNLTKIGKTKFSQVISKNCIDNQHYMVYASEYGGNIIIDENELESVRLFKFEEIEKLIEKKPKLFAAGFLATFPVFRKYLDFLKENK